MKIKNSFLELFFLFCLKYERGDEYMAVDPKLAIEAARMIKKKADSIFGEDSTVIMIVIPIVLVIILVFAPIYCILHPIEALSIAKGDSEITEEYLGYIAGKYETGTSDPGHISSGAGDYGGVSYGIPQFPTNGGMVKRFTNWLAAQDEELGSLFDELSPNTAEFNAAWKQAVEINSGKFATYQITYSHQVDVVPLVDKCLQELNIDFNRSRCLQELIISTGQQYGPNTSLIKRSGVTADMNDETIIKTIYAYKRNTVGSYFSGSSSSVQNSLRTGRFVEEEKDLLAIVGQPPMGIIGEDEMGISNLGYGLERDPGYASLKQFLTSWIFNGDDIAENTGEISGVMVIGDASGIVEQAQQYLGVPYVWGGTSSTGFDCSGLVQYVYAQKGIQTHRTSQEQFRYDGQLVSRNELEPGDLVFFDTEGSGEATHVGIYAGNNIMIHAPHTGDVVKYTDITSSYYTAHYLGAKRIIE